MNAVAGELGAITCVTQGEERGEEGRSVPQKGGTRITRVTAKRIPSSKPTAGPPVDAAGLSGSLGSGWSADDPDPGARAGKPTPSMQKAPGEVEPSGAAICATLRLGVVVAGMLPFPQPPSGRPV